MPCGEKISNYITVFIGEALIRVRRDAILARRKGSVHDTAILDAMKPVATLDGAAGMVQGAAVAPFTRSRG